METNQNAKSIKDVKAKDSPQVDRVLLGEFEARLLSNWVREFNEKADGLIKVSKADLVNYLIASHAPKLANDEVRKIAIRYYDETRWLSWSMVKMKEAKKKGTSILFDDLIKFRDELLGKIAVATKKRNTQSATDAPLKYDVKAQEVLMPVPELAETKINIDKEL